MPMLSQTRIEIVAPLPERGRICHALFDFDGTLSLIRRGWREVMIPMMVEILRDLETGETEEELTALVAEFVDRLTGKQTIYQMMALAEAVRERGGEPLDPLDYKWQYLKRLEARIEGRVTALQEGRVEPEAMMVPGALEMLEAVRARGVACYLASGTDEPYVWAEAELLGVTPYFCSIHGALDDYKSYSKKRVIDRIIEENDLSGAEFAGFGDGFVEIENVKAVGGIAVGVASNEDTLQGVNAWKRERLIRAGADIIIPDFREHEKLVAYLFPKE